MGRYVNPGVSVVEASVRQDIFVDKSLAINVLNKAFGSQEARFCVSRPRRFGKTRLSELISAYYTRGADSRRLFEGMKIAVGNPGWDEHLNQCNVVKIDMNGFFENYRSTGQVVKCMVREVADELRMEFPEVEIADGEPLSRSIYSIYRATGVRFVVIIDEYDVLVRERVKGADFAEYLSLLNALFKSADSAESIALAYITGILPVVRDKVQSKLNNFTEFTMLNAMQMAPYIGFTLDEVRDLCGRFGMDYVECLRWYDGYRLADGVSVCNANSVCKAIQAGDFANYWNATGSYRAASDYVDMNFEGARDSIASMLGGGRVPVQVGGFLNTLDNFASKDDLFAYLIHLGYLAYDRISRQCYIPNGEMMEEWGYIMRRTRNFKGIVDAMDASRQLLLDTLDMDEEAVARGLDRAHELTSSPLTYNNEGTLQSAIGLAYFYATADYDVVKEMPLGRGFADMAFVPRRGREGMPPIVVELKMDKNPRAAMMQIDSRRYAEALRRAGGEVLKVAVAYDRKTKAHSCKIEQISCP